MKAFIILAVVCCCISVWGAELSDDHKAKVKEYFDHCSKQENLSEADINRVRNKDFESPSEGMKCFSACFLEQAGVLKDNKLQEDVASQKLTAVVGEEKAKQILDKCKGATAANRCETGAAILTCASSHKAQILP